MFFNSFDALIRVVTVGVLGYVSLILLLRISGKRTLSKMNAFDLVVTVTGDRSPIKRCRAVRGNHRVYRLDQLAIPDRVVVGAFETDSPVGQGRTCAPLLQRAVSRLRADSRARYL